MNRKVNDYSDANRYYVYLHRRSKDKVVFYVGKGTGKRAYSHANNRSKHWLNFIGTDIYDTIIVAQDLAEEDAINIENSLITNPKDSWQLVNKRKSTVNKELDFDLLNEYLYYDPESPTGLRWKKDVGTQNSGSYRKAGDVAGSTNKVRNRHVVKLKGVIYKAHRVVVALHGIKIPTGWVVNHKDCDSSNNRIENLEVVTPRVNAQVKSDYVYRENIAGNVVGIFVQTRNGKHFLHASYIDENGTYKRKSLSTEKEDDVAVLMEELKSWREEGLARKLKTLYSEIDKVLEEV
jgi:hypothetical protein